MSDPTYAEYWLAVLGELDAKSLAVEHDLVAEGLEEWLASCETAAVEAGTIRGLVDIKHFRRALGELSAAINDLGPDGDDTEEVAK